MQIFQMSKEPCLPVRNPSNKRITDPGEPYASHSDRVARLHELKAQLRRERGERRRVGAAANAADADRGVDPGRAPRPAHQHHLPVRD